MTSHNESNEEFLIGEFVKHVYPGTRWIHRNGCKYTVIFLANLGTTDEEKYPVTVVYVGTNGRVWSRRADDWFRSMTKEE